MFYNTTNETGETLKQYKQKAMTQDERILHFFQTGEFDSYSPTQVWYAVFHDEMFEPTCPLTSVRRSMSDMKSLVKTVHTRKGDYGRREHYWMLTDPNQRKLSL